MKNVESVNEHLQTLNITLFDQNFEYAKHEMSIVKNRDSSLGAQITTVTLSRYPWY